MGDMVLDCVTAFKGRHKIQDRWENREYVVEKQPYPNIPVYVVQPIDREGHSWILHRNYLLPISPNLEHAKGEDSVEGVGPMNVPTPTPQADNVLPANWLMESQPESISNSAPEQHEPFDLESTGLTKLASSDPRNGRLKAEDTTPL